MVCSLHNVYAMCALFLIEIDTKWYTQHQTKSLLLAAYNLLLLLFYYECVVYVCVFLFLLQMHGIELRWRWQSCFDSFVFLPSYGDGALIKNKTHSTSSTESKHRYLFTNMNFNWLQLQRQRQCIQLSCDSSGVRNYVWIIMIFLCLVHQWFVVLLFRTFCFVQFQTQFVVYVNVDADQTMNLCSFVFMQLLLVKTIFKHDFYVFLTDVPSSRSEYAGWKKKSTRRAQQNVK